MTLPEVLQFFSATCALASAGCAVVVAKRAQRWRETDEAKHLMDRVDRVESRLDALEPTIAQLPSKADLEAVRGEVRTVCKLVDDNVVPGLRRIENYMMERAK